MTRAPRIKLVTRADDGGLQPAATFGVIDAFDHGIVRNASVMVPTPGFAAAAAPLAAAAERGLCIGLHVTLNAEWDGMRWGPVAPVARVRSLVMADEGFHPNPWRLPPDFRYDPLEALVEMEAQLNRMREAGLQPVYFDSHMGVLNRPDLAGVAAEFARRTGLFTVDGRVGPLPRPAAPSSRKERELPADGVDPWEQLRARLEAAPPGTWLAVWHPSRDEPEARALGHPGLAPGQIARERDAERRMLMAVETREWLEVNGVVPVTLAEALEG
jgi:predicted glycoside hydrolase/deacetylase ChbG (UPF0249 family)